MSLPSFLPPLSLLQSPLLGFPSPSPHFLPAPLLTPIVSSPCPLLHICVYVCIRAVVISARQVHGPGTLTAAAIASTTRPWLLQPCGRFGQHWARQTYAYARTHAHLPTFPPARAHACARTLCAWHVDVVAPAASAPVGVSLRLLASVGRPLAWLCLAPRRPLRPAVPAPCSMPRPRPLRPVAAPPAGVKRMGRTSCCASHSSAGTAASGRSSGAPPVLAHVTSHVSPTLPQGTADPVMTNVCKFGFGQSSPPLSSSSAASSLSSVSSSSSASRSSSSSSSSLSIIIVIIIIIITVVVPRTYVRTYCCSCDMGDRSSSDSSDGGSSGGGSGR